MLCNVDEDAIDPPARFRVEGGERRSPVTTSDDRVLNNVERFPGPLYLQLIPPHRPRECFLGEFDIDSKHTGLVFFLRL